MVNHVKLKIDYRIFELCTPRCVIGSISYLKSPVVPVKGISKTLYDGLVCRGYSTNRMLEPMDTFIEEDFFDFEE